MNEVKWTVILLPVGHRGAGVGGLPSSAPWPWPWPRPEAGPRSGPWPGACSGSGPRHFVFWKYQMLEIMIGKTEVYRYVVSHIKTWYYCYYETQFCCLHSGSSLQVVLDLLSVCPIEPLQLLVKIHVFLVEWIYLYSVEIHACLHFLILGVNHLRI